MRVSGHGVCVDVPAGWEARISRRGDGAVLHAASFPLLSSDGDFGAAATGRMRRGDGFLALVEYVDAAMIRPGVGLYRATRPPEPKLAEFGPASLQVTRPAQWGWQRFFTEGGRTCSLYAVIMPGAEPPVRLVRRLAQITASLRIAAEAGSG
ncbi:MAG TPA: hypothetical protein VFN48_05270 [Solirubrobacteraceae bacterium]|nr:hypothetical protein [Solirubrobacteraceae bacterium]